MRFEQYKKRLAEMLMPDEAGAVQVRYRDVATRQLNPLVLAYVGDACYHQFVRRELLKYEQNDVHLLHDLAVQIVSAKWQARAYRAIAEMLTEEEQHIFRRARNHKSHASRTASFSEYHMSTGFEALLGSLYLDGNAERLEEIETAALVFVLRELMEQKESNK